MESINGCGDVLAMSAACVDEAADGSDSVVGPLRPIAVSLMVRERLHTGYSSLRSNSRLGSSYRAEGNGRMWSSCRDHSLETRRAVGAVGSGDGGRGLPGGLWAGRVVLVFLQHRENFRVAQFFRVVKCTAIVIVLLVYIGARFKKEAYDIGVGLVLDSQYERGGSFVVPLMYLLGVILDKCLCQNDVLATENTHRK